MVQEALLRVHQALDDGERLAPRRVRRHRDHPAGDQRAALRSRPPGALCRQVAAEPIRITDGHDDPPRRAETADSLSLAMLVLLESLSPEQRAVLLLHDAFDYGYPEIAAIVGKSEDNVRQLATRTRRHVEQRRPRFQTTRKQRDGWHIGSSPPPSKAISPGSRPCSLTTSRWPPTVAAPSDNAQISAADGVIEVPYGSARDREHSVREAVRSIRSDRRLRRDSVAVDGEDPDDSSDPGLSGMRSRSMYRTMAVRNPTPPRPRMQRRPRRTRRRVTQFHPTKCKASQMPASAACRSVSARAAAYRLTRANAHWVTQADTS